MSKRSKKLERIVQLEKNTERIAAQTLAGSLREHQQLYQQLAELKQYRVEYSSELCVQQGSTVLAAQAMQISRFVQQLDQVILIMEGQVENLKQRRDSDQRLWTQRRRKTRALGDILEQQVKLDLRYKDAKADNEIDDLYRADRVEN